MLKPRNAEERRYRIMGRLLNVFDRLKGKTWFTLAGVIILIVLVALSFWPL